MGKRVQNSKQQKGGKVASKDITPQASESKAMTTPGQPGGFFSQISARDVTMAKILPLHYMSEKVKDKNIEAKAGELRDTVSNELFGDTDHPFEFIPLGLQKWWVETNEKTKEFIEKYPVTPANENQPLEEGDIKRVYTMEYFVMVPKKIEEMGTHVPYVLSFRITSLKAGKNLATKIWELQMAKKAPWELVFELSVKEASNDKGDFFVQNVMPKRKSKPEEIAECAKWFHMMSSGEVNAKVDDSDLKSGQQEMSDVNTDRF